MSGETLRVRLDLAYDGTDFAGWQYQPRLRTVQGVLERVFGSLRGRERAKVTGAGRTDAGVHARHQVAHVDLDPELAASDLVYTLRRMLPEDVRVASAVDAPARFHAIHSALQKTYRYRIDRSRGGDPLVLRYALHHPRPLDADAMREGLALLPGRRDWTCFANSACSVPDRVRDLRVARYDEGPENVGWFTFTADGFLNHMVRNIVGTLLEVGRGRFEPARVARVLVSGDRRLAGPAAPAKGLTLWSVEY